MVFCRGVYYDERIVYTYRQYAGMGTAGKYHKPYRLFYQNDADDHA